MIVTSLSTGVKNKFVVQTAGAGSGLLAVFVDGPSKVGLSCKEVDDGYEFTFTPFCPGSYLITIKYGTIPIAGSPYKTDVSGECLKKLKKCFYFLFVCLWSFFFFFFFFLL